MLLVKYSWPSVVVTVDYSSSPFWLLVVASAVAISYQAVMWKHNFSFDSVVLFECISEDNIQYSLLQLYSNFNCLTDTNKYLVSLYLITFVFILLYIYIARLMHKV